MKNVIQNPNQKVVITFDNNTTLARIYENNKVIAKGIATCSPEDEFDIKAGSELALTRALESMKPKHEWVVVNRKPRVGDYIRMKITWFSFNKVGDILKVSECINDAVGVNAIDHPQRVHDALQFGTDMVWHYLPFTFEVVEPAPKKPEFRKITRTPKKGDYVKVIKSMYCFDDTNEMLPINDVTVVDGKCLGLSVLHRYHTPAKHFDMNNPPAIYPGNFEWNYSTNLNELEFYEKVD